MLTLLKLMAISGSGTDHFGKMLETLLVHKVQLDLRELQVLQEQQVLLDLLVALELQALQAVKELKDLQVHKDPQAVLVQLAQLEQVALRELAAQQLGNTITIVAQVILIQALDF